MLRPACCLRCRAASPEGPLHQLSRHSKYVVPAAIIVVINVLFGNYGEPWLAGLIGNPGLANTIMSVVQALAAVVISFSLLKFWIAPAKVEVK